LKVSVKYIAGDDYFDKVYRASWIDGCINYWYGEGSWNIKNQYWKRNDQNMFVILKILNNPTSITFKFIYKV
jgi:hypothetical protein